MSVPGTSAIPERIHLPAPSSCLLEEVKCKQVQQTPRCTLQWPHGWIHFCSDGTREDGEGEQKSLQKGPLTPLLANHWTEVEGGKIRKRCVAPVSTLCATILRKKADCLCNNLRGKRDFATWFVIYKQYTLKTTCQGMTSVLKWSPKHPLLFNLQIWKLFW